VVRGKESSELVLEGYSNNNNNDDDNNDNTITIIVRPLETLSR
jgi:hypothetical protein